MKKLKITFLDFDDIKNPLLGAGQARATVEVGSRLVKRGHRVTVICSRYPGYKDRKDNGITYKHIGVGTNNIRLNNLLYILLLPFTVISLKGDIIIECFTAPISTLFSPLFTKIPVVAVPTSFEAERFAKLYHLPFDLIEKFGLRFYKYALPFTTHLEAKFRKVNKSVMTVVVPEGVSEQFFNIKGKKVKYILFLGRYDIGQKGIDLLLKAYSKVHKKVLPMLMVGVGPDKEKIERLIKNLKLQNKVTLSGPAYGKEKDEILSKALFVAFPSRHEGFSLFSLEALASGLPLVSFDIPSLSWTNEKVNLKAKAFDINAYSKLLVEASNYEVNKRMKISSRSIARKYTWENVAEKYENFFNSILS